MAIKTIGVAGQNLALADSVANSEAGGYLVVEIDVAELVEVTEDKYSDNIGTHQYDHLKQLCSIVDIY